MQLVAYLAYTKWCKKNHWKNDWKSGTLVLIWEYSVRAIKWIPTWQGWDVFSKSLSDALDESSLSIGRVLKSVIGLNKYCISTNSHSGRVVKVCCRQVCCMPTQNSMVFIAHYYDYSLHVCKQSLHSDLVTSWKMPCRLSMLIRNPEKAPSQDTQIFLWGISWKVNLKHKIDFFHPHTIYIALYKDIMPCSDEFVHVFVWNLSILLIPKILQLSILGTQFLNPG